MKTQLKYLFKKLLLLITIAAATKASVTNVIKGTQASLEFRGAGDIDVFGPGTKLFSDRSFTLSDEVPEELVGHSFLRNSYDSPEDWLVTESGELVVLTPVPIKKAKSRVEELKNAGFEQISKFNSFQLFGNNKSNQVKIFQKHVTKGERYSFGRYVVALGFESAFQYEEKPWSENSGELLYNGIRLPNEWPPRNIDPADKSPMPVPYLDHPPEVIPIDVGRQLFIDDFLIEQTSLDRTFHKPEKYACNPVLKPETALEINETRVVPVGRGEPGNAAAVPKSGGIWWCPDQQHFKMWYEAGWIGTVCLAISPDGLNWQRPEFDIRPGTNQVLPLDLTADSWTVVRNWDATVSQEKWTMFIQPPGPMQSGTSLVSADGIHWTKRTRTGDALDRSTHFYNPFRKKWVYSIRAGFGERGRTRKYYECDDFIKGAMRNDAKEVIWLAADDKDGMDYLTGEHAQLYNFDAVAYESIMLGQFELHWGPPNPTCNAAGLPKITELQFAYSRDGFHFHRPDRRVHVPAERNDVWDRGYVQSIGNVCIVMHDELWFYYSAFRGNPSKTEKHMLQSGMYDHGATGLATLRRDGFASMDAGQEPGTLTTRPVIFSGKRLFMNVDAPNGRLRAEVLDEKGEPIEPFTLGNCRPLSTDSTLVSITWNTGSDLSKLSGRPVRFRFELQNGSLYAFWVSRDVTGRSDGYIAGGGPGYIGPTDTVGKKALQNKNR